ncbi:unnamed protein product [marine sediment metagenome]|uniref:Uncharacterized protein n=1 Tax=marine sediment metagenome TaxID=412755 RepID=X1GGX2_9ZZZZ
MPHLITLDGEVLTPNSKVERKACPFYGFSTIGKTMMDQRGNGCALFVKSCISCQMELSEQETDWNKCPYNNPKMMNILGGAMKNMTIFPREFGTEDRKWTGIRLTDWVKYIQDIQNRD